MPDTSSARNPKWSRDELILTLDLYVQFKGNPPGKTSKNIVELSDLLNKMGTQIADRKADYRNPNGVYMKVMNFRRFDPTYISQGKKGLQRGGKLEEDVWHNFTNDPKKLSETAKAIHLIVEKGAVPKASQEEDEEFAEAEEGRILTRVHRSRERSRKLVEQKKASVLKASGKLKCEACSFDFEEAYGERGKGFIEVHHIKPVHTLAAGDKTRLEDLALLCSNCHRIVHARQPWLTIEKLARVSRGLGGRAHARHAAQRRHLHHRPAAAPEWQTAISELMLAVERNRPTMMARIGVMRALNRGHVREFNPDRKITHWGKQELKRDRE